MVSVPQGFLEERRLLFGPWQAFERDVARLLIMNAFKDVRIVAGSGDHGADVLGYKNEELWVVQCKYTSNSTPPKEGVKQVVDAAYHYGAQRMVLATSRSPGDSLKQERERYLRLGFKVELATPARLLSLMSDSPEYPDARLVLRDYQVSAARRFREGLLDTGRAQIVMATGLGKTVVMAECVADLLRDGLLSGGKVLVLAHTRNLVDQLERHFWYQLPKWVPSHHMDGREEPSFWEGITFATFQSATSKLEKLPQFDLVLIDEAHHIGATTFRSTIEALDPPMLGGVTATPWRGDNYDIDTLLGPPLVKLGIAEGLQNGFLAEVDYRLLADNVDWGFVQAASRYRYSLSQLNRRLIIPTRDEEAARIIQRAFRTEQRRSGIVYSPSATHAQSFSAMLRQQGIAAEAILSENQSRDRDRFMSRFASGQLDMAVTVDLFNEGVDVPDVDLIVFMRVTHSRRIFVQQLGRGLRTNPLKDRVIVLDFVTDLRRVAEVVELDHASRGGIEKLGLGNRIIQFSDSSAGSFIHEWMLDQASLFLREDDAQLELPELEFPDPPRPGGVQ